MTDYENLKRPAEGTAIQKDGDRLIVPDDPILPFIEGDGTGPDIWRASKRVLDAAVENAYGGRRHIVWFEVFAGEKAFKEYGEWLPEDTLTAIREYLVSIKGPLTTSVGGGIRSLNVALRQKLDLFACVRPVRYFQGVPSPVKRPEQVDMVIFRENSEDIYAGIEYQSGTDANRRLLRFLLDDLGVKTIRFPDTAGIGIKPVSQEGTNRIVRAAIRHAIERGCESVTLVHKGNIMKFTEGAFRDWGYELAKKEFGAEEFDGGPWCRLPNGIVIKDVIADAFLQQILTRPNQYQVIATLNLNGDYISDALAAQVGGIGIAPGANIGDAVAVFEATHGTAPSFAGKDRVNPGSLILSAEMMLRYIGWTEAADLITKGVANTIANKELTFDLAKLRVGIKRPKRKERPHDRKEAEQELEQLVPGAKLLGTRDFGDAVIRHMDDA